MAADSADRKAILRATIDELRHTFNWIDSAHTRMKTKALAFIGGGLATLTFLYADADIFLPPQTYGKIFYFVGLGLLLTSLVMLLSVSLKPAHWEFSIEDKDIEAVKFPSNKDFLANEEEYLLYLKERYYMAYKMNLSMYEYACKWLNRAFIPLLSGAIVLAVLKIFGT